MKLLGVSIVIWITPYFWGLIVPLDVEFHPLILLYEINDGYYVSLILLLALYLILTHDLQEIMLKECLLEGLVIMCLQITFDIIFMIIFPPLPSQKILLFVGISHLLIPFWLLMFYWIIQKKNELFTKKDHT